MNTKIEEIDHLIRAVDYRKMSVADLRVLCFILRSEADELNEYIKAVEQLNDKGK